MFNLMIDPSDNDMWIDAIKGKYFGGTPFTKTEWDQLLGHCQVGLHKHHCALGIMPLDNAETMSYRASAISRPVPSDRS